MTTWLKILLAGIMIYYVFWDMLMLEINKPKQTAAIYQIEEPAPKDPLVLKCEEYANNAKGIMDARQKGFYQHIVKEIAHISNANIDSATIDLFVNDAFNYDIVMPPDINTNNMSWSDRSKLSQYVLDVSVVKKRFYEKYYDKCMSK